MIDRGEEDGRQFIVFELVEGENLKELVERGGPLPGAACARARARGRPRARLRARARAHPPRRQAAERAPDGAGRAKVTDFGIVARSTQSGHDRDRHGARHEPTTSRRSRHGASASTRRPTSTRSASSCTSCWPASVPYAGDNFLAVAMKHVNDPVPSVLESVRMRRFALAALVERCLRSSPRTGSASMDEVVASSRPSRPSSTPKDGRRGDDDHAQGRRRRRPAATPAAPGARRGTASRSGCSLLGLAARAVAVRDRSCAGRRRRHDRTAGAGSGAVALSGVGVVRPARATARSTTSASPTRPTATPPLLDDATYVGLALEAGRRPRARGRRARRAALTWSRPTRRASPPRSGRRLAEGPFDAVVGPAQTTSSTTTWSSTDGRALLRRLDHRLDRVAARQRGQGSS